MPRTNIYFFIKKIFINTMARYILFKNHMGNCVCRRWRCGPRRYSWGLQNIFLWEISDITYPIFYLCLNACAIKGRPRIDCPAAIFILLTSWCSCWSSWILTLGLMETIRENSWRPVLTEKLVRYYLHQFLLHCSLWRDVHKQAAWWSVNTP